jgi:hypothetical protein
LAIRRWSSIVLSVALTGLVILPVVAFIGGYLVAGQYEGAFGVIGYLGSIYADLLDGQRAAVVLVLTPAVIVTAWYLVGGLRTYLARRD